MDNKALNWICLTLLIVGAINWGLVGFFQFDLIAAVFGGVSAWFSRIVYALVGLSGLYCLSFYSRFDDERHALKD